MPYELPTPYQQFIAKSRYARWLEDKQRRETWDETINRYLDFFFFTHKPTATAFKRNTNADALRAELYEAMGTLQSLPSMRCLMTAGPALEKDNIAGFNCSYLSVDDVHVFSEMLYILLNGVGAGFSVERQYINKLPDVPDEFYLTETTIVVDDSKLGWAKSFHELVTLLYQGQIPKWDMSRVRPSGARLKTFGGRASGPEPLDRLFKFTVNTFKNAAGRKLESIECHDLLCMIGEIVVVGGVRRCLPAHTLVHTDNGLVEIKDVKPGMMVYSDRWVLSKVLAKENVGVKKTITIRTRAGSITCTKEHRVAVLTNVDTGKFIWKEAGKLTPGDVLMYSSNVTPGGETRHPDWSYTKPKNSTTCKDITPQNVDPLEMAWFIGYLHGNGCVLSNLRELVFAVPFDMPHTRARLKNVLESFGVNIGDVPTGEGCWKLRVKSRQLALYLSQFKLPNVPIHVPEFVLRGDVGYRHKYLAGLFDADGSAKSSRPGRKIFNVVTTVYKELADQVGGLLASLGIPYKVHVNVPKEVNWSIKYNVIVTGSAAKDELAQRLLVASEKIKRDYVWDDVTREMAVPVITPELLREAKYKGRFSPTYCSSTNLPWVNYTYASGKKYWYTPAMVISIEDESSVECYDIQVAKTEAFFANGFLVHNSATLSLSNLSDLRMRDAKSGNWWEAHPHRKLANNSVAYTERPELVHFMEEWVSLYKSHSGERGIVNREALRYGAKKYGKRDPKQIVGVNPCCEVTLRSMQFCNLSTIILRPEDTREVILKKVRIAAIFGTMQATLTSFRFLRKKWKQNTEEEALLGVSMTGILDHPLLGALGGNEERDALLREMREVVEAVNAEYADLFGINHATACTAIKPEGTVSELVDSASGIHPRWSEYYLRSVRGDNKDPLTQFLRATGIRYEPEIGKEDSTTVFYFAKKSPDTSVTRDRITAIQQLELWKTYQVHYCEHKPSITVYVREDEWLGVAAWVWENFDIVSGVSFLPYDNGVYQQAPYNAATENEYLELLEKTPNIDWQMLEHFEKDDEAVNGTREYACVSGACELR